MGNSINQYRASTQKIADNLWAELAKQEINWHTVGLIGRELVVLAGEAQKEQVRQKLEYMKSKYEEG